MRPRTFAVYILLCAAGVVQAASRPHVVSFGKWITIKLFTGPDEDQPIELKVRALYVDGKLKEYTFGPPHEITERLFVARRVVRVNDALPSETGATLRWIWQRGGWLAVDRGSGRVSQVNLPDFDPDCSVGSWYRDYVAYWGVLDESKKLVAIVMQIGRRKPVLKKSVGESVAPDSDCTTPVWQRQPPRVSFVWKPEQKVTYTVRGHMVEMSDDEEEGTE